MLLKIIFLSFTLTSFASYSNASCPQVLYANGPLAKTPTSITRSKAIPANTTIPVFVVNGVFDFLRLKNLGNGVEVYANEAIDMSIAVGGTLCKNIYKLHKTRFLINPDVNGRSGAVVDGKKTPLESNIIYYNIKYGSFKNALKHRDGVLVIVFQIAVGPIFNPLFTPVQFLLSLGVIKKPGSEFPLPSILAYIWYDVILFITEYYSFQGTYLDLSTGKYYPALHVVAIQPVQATISYSQFKAFKNILGYNGKPINTSQPLFPLGRRTVVKGKGYVQVPVPL